MNPKKDNSNNLCFSSESLGICCLLIALAHLMYRMAFRARSEISLYINQDTSVYESAPSEAEMMDTEEEV